MNATIDRHIASKPGVCGGRPCIAGTRIRVQDIYVWSILQKQTPEQIIAEFPQLTMADVHAALAFYWDNRELIHQEMKEEDAFVEEMKRIYPSRLREKMLEKGLDPDTLPS